MRQVGLAGAKGGGELKIGLQAAVNLDGGVAGADDALADAPRSECGEALPGEGIQALDYTIVEAHKAQAAAIGKEIGG